MSKLSIGSDPFMDDFIAALRGRSDPNKLTFFKMAGPVAIRGEQVFVAKSRASRVQYSSAGIDEMVAIHGNGVRETLYRAAIDELVTEILSELQSETGKTTVGIYQVISKNAGVDTDGFIVRYAIGPGVE